MATPLPHLTHASLTEAAAKDEAARDVLHRLAADLVPALERLVAECCAYIEAAMPELEQDEELRAGLFDSANDNLRRIFAMLAEGVPVSEATAPPGALAYANIMARRGTPVATLLRAYRYGHMWFWSLWKRELTERVQDPERLVPALDLSLTWIFDYVDIVSDEVTSEYATARERWLRSAAALRAETVQRLLAGDAIDISTAGRRLGYELRRHHLALIVWTTPDDEMDSAMQSLETAAGRIADTLGAARPLFIPRGRAELWVWLGFDRAPAAELLQSLSIPGVCAAAGEPHNGVEGFRRSFREAQHARDYGLLTARAAGRVLSYERIVVGSLLASDLDRAGCFVERELGALGADDDATTRIRATIRVFLEEGSRYTSTARRLGVHQNTVVYRVRRAEELLGRPLAERRFELETALRLLPVVSR